MHPIVRKRDIFVETHWSNSRPNEELKAFVITEIDKYNSGLVSHILAFSINTLEFVLQSDFLH